MVTADLVKGFDVHTEITTQSTTLYRGYFGNVSKSEYRRGIYMATFNTETGDLSKAIRVSDAVHPGFITIHPDGKHLYATGSASHFSGHTKGAVSAYRIIEPHGVLEEINTQPSGGLGPTYISVDPTGKHLLVANYKEGSCSVLNIEEDYSLNGPRSIHQHYGFGAHPMRQDGPHIHSIQCDPAGRFTLVTDMGTDQILIYRLDGLTGHLCPHRPPYADTPPGSGPRHLTFHPSGEYVYAVMELSNQLIAYEYGDKYGTLREIQLVSTVPREFTRRNTASEVAVSPDGKFVYVGNRGHNSIAVFATDPVNGKVSLVGHEPTRGNHPHSFRIDPSGSFLMVANAFTDNIVLFKIDKDTGTLSYTGRQIEIPHPTCIQFAPVPQQDKNISGHRHAQQKPANVPQIENVNWVDFS